MLQKRLDTLIEQTAFLLDKHKEMQEEFGKSFDFILNEINQKLGSTEGDTKDLEEVKKIIEDQSQKSAEEFVQDTQFLEDQVNALNKIKDVQDPKKAEELLNMIIASDEELEGTPELKKHIESEILASKRELQLMKDDICNSLKEGDFKELKLLLQALGSEQEDETKSDSDSCCSSDCNGCDSASECGDSCCSGGVDIFSALADLDKKDNN